MSSAGICTAFSYKAAALDMGNHATHTAASPATAAAASYLAQSAAAGAVSAHQTLPLLSQVLAQLSMVLASAAASLVERTGSDLGASNNALAALSLHSVAYVSTHNRKCTAGASLNPLSPQLTSTRLGEPVIWYGLSLLYHRPLER